MLGGVFLFWMTISRVAILSVFILVLAFSRMSCERQRCVTIIVCLVLLISCLVSAGIGAFVLRGSAL